MDNRAGQETDQLQFQKVYYHRVGTKQSEDALIHENKDEPLWMFSAYLSNNGEYLFLSTSKDTDDIGLLAFFEVTKDTKFDEQVKFTPILDQWIGGFYYMHNVGSKALFQTNYQAPMGKIIQIDL